MPDQEALVAEETEPLDLERWSEEHPNDAAPECRRGYRIRINAKHYVVRQPAMTGRELLVLAKKTPPEQFRLMLKQRGGQSRPIGLDERVSFRAPGVERFITIALDPTDGGH